MASVSIALFVCVLILLVAMVMMTKTGKYKWPGRILETTDIIKGYNHANSTEMHVFVICFC